MLSVGWHGCRGLGAAVDTRPDIRLGFGLFPLVEVFIQHFETSVPYVQAVHWEFAAHERQHATESEMDGRPPSTRSLPK